jgi:hypothetical protein
MSSEHASLRVIRACFKRSEVCAACRRVLPLRPCPPSMLQYVSFERASREAGEDPFLTTPSGCMTEIEKRDTRGMPWGSPPLFKKARINQGILPLEKAEGQRIGFPLLPPNAIIPSVRRGAGVVERGGLENRCSLFGYRGFESLPLRFFRGNIFCIGMGFSKENRKQQKIISGLPFLIPFSVANIFYSCRSKSAFRKVSISYLVETMFISFK